MTADRAIRILENREELFQAAASEFSTAARQTARETGRFTVALSGGSTPRGLYSLLSSSSVKEIPWDKTWIFFGDERHVPADQPDSNYRMANRALLSRVPLPAEHVFRIPAEQKDANLAAELYEKTLKKFFQLQSDEFPRFDLILLGMGSDGHTASLFPGSSALQESRRMVVANWVEKFKTHRITLTYPALNHAARVIFLISGKDKADAAHEILDSHTDLPAARVQPDKGSLLWLLDREAASSLSIRSSPERQRA